MRFAIFLLFCIELACSFRMQHYSSKFVRSHETLRMVNSDSGNQDRKELWKKVSQLEKEAIQLLTSGGNEKIDDALIKLAKSTQLKETDPFLHLATAYAKADESGNIEEKDRLLAAMRAVGLPPHITNMVSRHSQQLATINDSIDEPEIVDPGSTFSDTVTEKVRVKITSHFDKEKTNPTEGKYMFWYKVAIYNEGPEPVQVVSRMWEIEKCRGEKEVVRGPGIQMAQPIIPPGDVFTYQSTCPVKVFPPKGKRVIASMSGAYTMCRGNMGQHNFTVKVGKFNLIVPETVST